MVYFKKVNPVIIIFFICPVIHYDNADIDKVFILKDNKHKVGIYFWIHLKFRKIYVGSAVDLFKRLRLYLSISYLIYHRNSHIYRAFFKNYFIKCTLPPGSLPHKGM